MITLFAENRNFNKLSSQLNPQQITDPNAVSNSKPKGRTQRVQNYQNSRFRQATRTIALFAENQISTNYPDNLIPTKLFLNTKFKRRTQRIQDPVTPFAKTFKNCISNAYQSHSSSFEVKTIFRSQITFRNKKGLKIERMHEQRVTHFQVGRAF